MLPPRRYIFHYVQYNAQTEQCQPISLVISQFFAIFVKQKMGPHQETHLSFRIDSYPTGSRSMMFSYVAS